ncbi:YihY/virulence factor BrkB family protein [Paucibacter sp. PLA-PC-4]|uniref:YihY/virulence factor BrkB family protein n=1 Tax=Paucibacter sp. PLA-PC-4 TaxID=2993655 RepID=UPI00224AF0B4|nr:YihY/virulence factor BrkB family protein [Paucibacter sp. PLA-PC-4]MCX2865328.1 YihY/virulence factor BrkB family protein [Paucibacter sp. PLA-PC-4]
MPPLTPAEVLSMARRAGAAWLADGAPSMGAAIAYYTLFSLAPLLLIVVSVAGLVFGAEAARGEIYGQLQSLLGSAGALAVQGLLESVNRPGGSLLATVSGLVLMLIGATSVFAELQNTLDRIWRVPARPLNGLWALLRARLLSFGLILGFGFLLMVSLLMGAALSALHKWWSPLLGGWDDLILVIDHLLSFGLMTAMFALIYKIMPRARVAWVDVWVGAVVTAALFSIGRSLIGLYIGSTAISSGFGAAGSLVVLLIWVYYSAQIFLLGAEFTWVFAHARGSRRHLPMPS